MAKMTIDGLAAAVEKIMDDYAAGVISGTEEAIKKAAAKAKTTLASTSPRSSGGPSFGKKHYADQWAVKNEISRVAFESIIYNQAPTYRLAHLLENGYTMRNGRRVQGRPHIRPVEDTVINEVLRGIEEAARK